MQDQPTTRAMWLRYRLDAYRANRDDFPVVVLALAVELFEARKEVQGDDRAFGRWLVDNDLNDLSKDDRASFIGIGEHAEIAAPILRETTSRSVELIWRNEIKPICRSAPIDAQPQDSISNTPESAPPTQENQPSGQAANPKMSPDDKPKPPTISGARRRRSPLKHLPDFELVMAYMQADDVRTMVGKLCAKNKNRAVWSLLVDCISNGTFGEPTNKGPTQPSLTTLRLLFPWMPHDGFTRSFDLTKDADRQTVRDVIVPFLLRNPERSARMNELVAAEVRRVRIEREESARRATAPPPIVAHETNGEKPVIIFGRQLWPADHAHYTHAELIHAAWYATYIFDLLGNKTMVAKRMDLMHTVKFIRDFLTPGAYAALEHIGTAAVDNPLGTHTWPAKPAHFFVGR